MEFGLFPVGSGKPAQVFKWILIPLPMGDGWRNNPGRTLPGTLTVHSINCSANQETVVLWSIGRKDMIGDFLSVDAFNSF